MDHGPRYCSVEIQDGVDVPFCGPWTVVLQCSCSGWSRNLFVWIMDHGTIVFMFRME